MRETSFIVRWHDPEAEGYSDVLPRRWFEKTGKQVGLTHPVIDRAGKKVGDAQCDVTVTDTFAELNYERYGPFNEKRKMLLGVLQVVFDAKRSDITQVLWKNKGSTKFVDDEATIELASLGELDGDAPKGIPDGIARKHVLQAFRDFDAGVPHSFHPSTDYDVLLGEKRYPPKAIIGLAARRLNHIELGPEDFSGGEKSKCFRVLRSLGFEVLPKREASIGEGEPESRVFQFETTQTYTRRDIRRVIGMPENQTGGKVDTGYFEHDGAFFILCGIGTAGRTGHDYGNRFEDDRLVWSGKTGARLKQPMIQRMIAAGAEVHVFHREHDRQPFTYAGCASMAEANDVVPVRITWKFDASLGGAGAPAQLTTEVKNHLPADSRTAASYFVKAPAGARTSGVGQERGTGWKPRKTDYAARDVRNETLGKAGERFVFELEKKLLSEAGRSDLAARVRWVSKDDGDGLGYDIASFRADTGAPLLIEVKTTTGAAAEPFFITQRELACADANIAGYRFYRVFDFAANTPQLFVLEGPMREKLALAPKLFEASLV